MASHRTSADRLNTMMQRGLVALGVLLASLPGAAAQENLLINPDFENGLSFWTDLYGLPSELSTEAHGGLYSASKQVDPATINDQDYWSQLYQEVAIVPGEPVYASMYVQTTFTPPATAVAGIMLEFFDDNGNEVPGEAQSASIGGQTPWRLLETTIAAAPEGATTVRLSAWLWALQGDQASLTGSAYFDDAFLSKEYRPPQAQTRLYNPGFENGLHDWHELYGDPSALSSTVVHAGQYAAQKTITQFSGNQDYWSQIYQELICAPGQRVRAGMYVKTDFAIEARARAGIMLEFLDVNGVVLLSVAAPLVGGQSDWQLVTLRRGSAPDGTATVRFSGIIYAPYPDTPSLGGIAYYDDAKIAIQ